MTAAEQTRPAAAAPPARGPRPAARTLGLAVLVAGLIAGAASGAAAQEEITARRFADVVAVRRGPAADERVLYYFSPTAQLQKGDEIEQGGGAHAQLSLSAAGRVEFHGPTHVIVHRLAAEGDVLRFVALSRASAVSGDRVLTLVLPNGARCILDGARVELQHEHGRLRVRNTGALPVIVRGALELVPGQAASPQSLDKIVLSKGEEVRMPYFEEPEPLDQPQATAWGGLMVRHDEGVELEAGEQHLRISARRDAELRVAGVRTTLAEGRALVIVNRRAPTVDPPAETSGGEAAPDATEPTRRPDPTAAPEPEDAPEPVDAPADEP